MQSLKLIGQQLASIWQEIGLNQKITLVLAALAVFALLFSLIFFYGRGDYALLYGRLDPAEAGKVIASLDEMNIKYQTRHGGQAIYVPQDKVHLARIQLAAKGIPKSDGVGFEIFDKPTFGMSEFVQQANYIRAIQGELARTIAQIDGIESARVFIVIPENRLLIDPEKRATASVFVNLRGMSSLPPHAVNAIRFLVANSVVGLRPNNVMIADNSGRSLSEDSEEGSLGAISSGQLNAKRNVETYLANKVESMLETVLGARQAVVRVSAALQTENITTTGESFAEGVPRTIQEREETTKSLTPTPGGIPGVTINANVDADNPALASTMNELTKWDTQTDFALSRTMSNIVQVAGGVRSVSVAVLVNNIYQEGLPIPRTPAQISSLERVVRNALGSGIDPEVEILEMEFKDPIAIEIATTGRLFIKEFEQDQYLWLWEAAKNAIFLILGVVALLVFWKLAKRTSEELIPTGVPVGQLIGGQMVYQGAGQSGVELPQGGGIAGVAVSAESTFDQYSEEIEPSETGEGQDVELVQAAKSKMVMDFGLGQQRPERVTIEVLKQLIRENPLKMSQAARTWMTSNRPETPEL